MSSGARARRIVKLKGNVPNSVSWIRLLEDGRIELEYFDRGAGSEDHFGGDVAWMYRVSASDEPRLRGLLEKQANAAITDDRALLGTLAQAFPDAWAIRHWLREKGIRFEEEFDSWP